VRPQGRRRGTIASGADAVALPEKKTDMAQMAARVKKAFQRKGYTGYASYEAPNPAAWKRPAEDVAREALAATRAVLR